MTQRRTTALAIAGTFLTGLIILMLFAPALFPRARMRAEIIRQLEARLHQPVSVGEVGLRILPSPRFFLSNLEIGSATVTAEPHATLANLDLRLRLWPLLRKRVEITGIELERPYVQLRLAESAMATRTSLPSEREEPPERAARPDSGREARTPAPVSSPAATDAAVTRAQRLPLQIQVRSLRISDGRVVLLRPNGDSFLELLHISEVLSAGANPDGDLNLNTRTRIDTVVTYLGALSLGRTLSVDLGAKLHYRSSEDRLQIERGTIELAGLPVAIAGELRGVKRRTYEADLTLSGGPAMIEDIRAFIPAALAPQTGDIQSEGTLSVQAHVRGPLAAPPGAPAPKPDFEARVQLTGGTLKHPALPEGLRGIELDVRATPDVLTIGRFSAESGESRLRASGTAASYTQQPDIDFSAEADIALALLGRLRAAKDSPEWSGRAAARLRVQGPALDALALRADGEATLTNVSATGGKLPVAIRDINGTLRIVGQDLAVQNLTGMLGSSDLRIDGALRNPGALLSRAAPGGSATLNLQLASTRLVLDELLALFAQPKERREGQPASEETPTTLTRLSGQVQTSIRELTYRATTARDVHGTLVLDRGLLRLENLDLAVFGGELGLGGNLDLRDAKQAAFDVDIDLRSVQVDALFDYAARIDRILLLKDHLSGNANISAGLSGKLDQNLALEIATLAADGAFETKDAQLSGHPLQEGLASFLDLADLQTLTIEDWHQPFQIAQGRLNLSGMRIAAGDIAITGEGWQSLDGELRMAVGLALPARLSGKVSGQLPAELKPLLFESSGERMQIPLRLSGHVKSPKVSFDTDMITARAKSVLREQLSEARKDVESNIRQRVEEALAGSPPTDSLADSTRPDLQRQAGKLLRDLFKRR